MSLDKSLDELVEGGGPVRSRAGRPQRKSEPYSKGRGKGKGKSQNWASLVDSVREAQRSSRDWVTAWRELCDSEGTGDYDPARYDHEFLRYALAELGHSGAESDLAADGDESWSKGSWRTSSGRRGSGSNNGLMRPGLGNGAGHADLVQSLKQWHRGKPRNVNAWRAYCEEHGDGSYDPSRYTAAFLRAALRELAGGREGGGGGAWEEAPLAEQVRDWQRASVVHTLAWRQYCDERGGAAAADLGSASNDEIAGFEEAVTVDEGGRVTKLHRPSVMRSEAPLTMESRPSPPPLKLQNVKAVPTKENPAYWIMPLVSGGPCVTNSGSTQLSLRLAVCQNHTDQQWYTEKNRLKSALDERCLEYNPKGQLRVDKCAATDTQAWKFTKLGQIKSKSSKHQKKCIQVETSEKALGNLFLANCSKSGMQAFKFQEQA